MGGSYDPLSAGCHRSSTLALGILKGAYGLAQQTAQQRIEDLPNSVDDLFPCSSSCVSLAAGDRRSALISLARSFVNAYKVCGLSAVPRTGQQKMQSPMKFSLLTLTMAMLGVALCGGQEGILGRKSFDVPFFLMTMRSKYLLSLANIQPLSRQ